MRLNSNVFYLPVSILLLVASHTTVAETSEDQSPAPWPKHVRYWPEDPPHRRRDLEALEEHVRRGESPVGIMKMRADPGEKFYMEYWQYDGELGQSQTEDAGPDVGNLRARRDEDAAGMLANVSMLTGFQAPFALHSGNQNIEVRKARPALGPAAAALAYLEKRDFTCPGDTSNCAAIGYPNYCCATSERCFEIRDTGLGPVGCCPTGSVCDGTISICNEPNTACPQSLGGGCCIPNYVCGGLGCVMSIVTTVIVTQSLSLPSPSETSRATSTITTVVPPAPIPTSTTGGVSLTCRSDSNPCPSSLGGGCCHTDRVCAASMLCAPLPGSPESSTTTDEETSSPSATVTGGPAVRPTSDENTTTGPLLTTSCPVYFYACSARYGGGCCQTGRNCDVTSCPPTSSTTIISEGRTVVVPVGPAATTNSPTGTCAPSWTSCAASLGGNCCPDGWQCGTASCSSVGPSNTAVEQKKSPNAGTSARRVGNMGGVVVFVLMIMITTS